MKTILKLIISSILSRFHLSTVVGPGFEGGTVCSPFDSRPKHHLATSGLHMNSLLYLCQQVYLKGPSDTIHVHDSISILQVPPTDTPGSVSGGALSPLSYEINPHQRSSLLHHLVWVANQWLSSRANGRLRQGWLKYVKTVVFTSRPVKLKLSNGIA